ncbi:nuclear transport factor 2 family protein [Micromonospora sp. DR5-3]|uniref:nuclear transport factor 2 family protein n=1 Tax=unclassified Micromonospora TaxID=2617518 RepID=UPI001CA35231|nr:MULTISPECIES: nuclear transport factor 2 family protein [unclassified Micromonospora]MCW3819054.1 nuclear transport factor 2 family protein [Micromonospora sp. DR5-3]
MITAADRAEIGELVHRYAYLVDNREIQAVAELFLDAAVLVLPDPPTELGPVRRHAGRAQIVRALRSLSEIPVTLHAVLGLVVDPDGAGGAVGSVTGVAHHVSDRPDGTTADLVWYLRYADTYQRDGGRWRIARRALQIEWMETRRVRQRRRSVRAES